MRDQRQPLPHRWPVIFLAGPVVWYMYFWIVYLVAEAGCADGAEDFQILGWSGVSFMTTLLTAAAGGLIAWFLWIGFRDRNGRGVLPGDDDPDDYRSTFVVLGVSLAVLFITASLFVGLPALVLTPC